MNRIYGKPEAALVTHAPANPAADVIRAMTLAEKLALLRRLRPGKFDDAAPAVPIVEAVPPAGWPSRANAMGRSESQRGAAVLRPST